MNEQLGLTHYPPTILEDGSVIPLQFGEGGNKKINIDLRNQQLSRIQFPHYEFGTMDIEYTPKIDMSRSKSAKFLKLPKPQFTMLDAGRQAEIDNFYLACQMHRKQYMDESGYLHPLKYFHETDKVSHIDCTSKYLQSPPEYVKYKDPQVWLILKNVYTSIPQQTLAGKFFATSDVVYKR